MDNNTCCFEVGARNTVCSVRVIADVLPEDDEDFYFAIVPQNGQLICRKNFAIGIIQNVEGILYIYVQKICFEYTVCTVYGIMHKAYSMWFWLTYSYQIIYSVSTTTSLCNPVVLL